MKKFQPKLEANTGLRQPPALSTCRRFLALLQISTLGPKSVRFIVGTALIGCSFLVYLAYPIILLMLPFSARIKAGATVAVWVLGWGVFSAGLFLTGPEGYEWLKALWTRMTRGRSRKKAE